MGIATSGYQPFLKSVLPDEDLFILAIYAYKYFYFFKEFVKIIILRKE